MRMAGAELSLKAKAKQMLVVPLLNIGRKPKKIAL